MCFYHVHPFSVGNNQGHPSRVPILGSGRPIFGTLDHFIPVRAERLTGGARGAAG